MIRLPMVAPVPRTLTAALVFAISVALPLKADQKTDIGFTELQNRLGAQTPTGAGVKVTQVEADENGGAADRYLPDRSNEEFDGKSFSDGTESNLFPSGHATTVGRFFYGDTSSVAPGVTNITGYEANDYINTILNFSSGALPLAQAPGVQSHAYVGTAESDSVDANILGRFDHAIDMDDFTAIVGMPNSGGGAQPLLGGGFNSIAIGLTSGAHGSGPTTVADYVPGRNKPDLVAPGTSANPGTTRTSWATAQTASAAALLHEAAAGTDAVRPEVMKAVLMAGATKSNLAFEWSHSPASPLDSTFGAGALNVFNSFVIIDSGRQNGGSGIPPLQAAGHGGWDYQSGITPNAARHYHFDIPANRTGAVFSAVLTWNAEVTDVNGNDEPVFSVANFDLWLFDSTDTITGQPLEESVSTDHNVEHIYATQLESGSYTLEVISDSDRDFGIAWRTELNPELLPGDMNGDGDVNAFDIDGFVLALTDPEAYLAETGLPPLTGDINGDGALNAFDIDPFVGLLTASSTP